MAAAKYTIHVPAVDQFNQPLKIHHAVRQHLNNLGIDNATLHEGDPTHSVTGWTDDTPEWDSTMKQLGVFAGELANVPTVHVTKEGDKPATWPMANPDYQEGIAAEQCAIAGEPNISTIHNQSEHEDWMSHPLSQGIDRVLPDYLSAHSELATNQLAELLRHPHETPLGPGQ
jgi:hypothetical protein